MVSAQSQPKISRAACLASDGISCMLCGRRTVGAGLGEKAGASLVLGTPRPWFLQLDVQETTVACDLDSLIVQVVFRVSLFTTHRQ